MLVSMWVCVVIASQHQENVSVVDLVYKLIKWFGVCALEGATTAVCWSLQTG